MEHIAESQFVGVGRCVPQIEGAVVDGVHDQIVFLGTRFVELLDGERQHGIIDLVHWLVRNEAQVFLPKLTAQRGSKTASFVLDIWDSIRCLHEVAMARLTS